MDGCDFGSTVYGIIEGGCVEDGGALGDGSDLASLQERPPSVRSLYSPSLGTPRQLLQLHIHALQERDGKLDS